MSTKSPQDDAPSLEPLLSYQDRRQNGTAEPREEFLARFPQLQTTLEELESMGLVPPEADPSSALPREFDGYTLVRELGHGGMGTVYEAWQGDLERRVAIKAIHSHQIRKTSLRERFEREVSLLGQLEDPNIVRIYGSGVVQGVRYIVMELVKGTRLQERVPDSPDVARRRPVVEMIRLVDAGAKIARSLAQVHERGIVHRDVKPANILLNAKEVPVLIDFGLARDTESESMTEAGGFVGTLLYAAPEQVRGERVDRRADVYGLGATLYHVLTGLTPYPARTIGELVARMKDGPAKGARSINPALPRAIATVLDKALAYDPMQRYGSCYDFAIDLDAACTGKAISARPEGTLLRWLRSCHRRPAVSVAILGIVVAVLLGLTLLWITLKIQARERDLDYERDKTAFGLMLDVTSYNSGIGRARAKAPLAPNQEADLDPTTGTLREARVTADLLLQRRSDDLEVWLDRALLEIRSARSSLSDPVFSPTDLSAAGRCLDQAPTALREQESGRFIAALIAAGGALDPEKWMASNARAGSGPRSLSEARNLGLVLLTLGKPAIAIRVLDPYLDTVPRDARVFMYAARACFDLEGEEMRGLRYAHMAYAWDPRPHTLMRIALLESSFVRIARDESAVLRHAIQTARKALAMDPEDSSLMQVLGYLLSLTKQPEFYPEIEKLYRAAIQRAFLPSANYNLNFLLSKMNKLDPIESTRLLEPVEKHYRSDFAYWRARAWSVWKLEGPERAADLLERVRDQVPDEERYLMDHVILLHLSDLGTTARERRLRVYDRAFAVAPQTREGIEELRGMLATLKVEDRSAEPERTEAFLERAVRAHADGVVLPELVHRMLVQQKRIK